MKAREFKEAKIKMVMGLKRLERRAAIASIARMNAAKRKAAEEEEAQEAERKARLEAAHERLRNRRNRSANIGRDADAEFVSAEEFFSDIA